MKPKHPISRTGSIFDAAVLLLLSGTLAISARAQVVWTGTGDGISWNDAANWSTGALPDNTAGTQIGSNTNGGLLQANVVMGNGVVASIAGLNLGQAAANHSGTLTLEGNASLTSTGANVLLGNYGHGTLIMKGTSSLIFNTSGNNNLGGGIRLNASGHIHITGSASLTMNAGNYIGGERDLMTMLIEDHGSFTMNHNNAVFYPTYASTKVDNNVIIKDHGVLSVVSGTVILGYNATATGTFILRGNETDGRGKAIVRAVVGRSDMNILLFDGGILMASDNSVGNFISGFNAVNATIHTTGEGAFIDSNNRSIGIANTVSIAGSGGITKIGEGTLTLNTTSANTTFTGTTAVKQGMLVLGGEQQLSSSGAVNIAASSTLYSPSFNQTLNGLSGNGIVDLASGIATLGGSGTSTFSGFLTAATIIKEGSGRLTLSSSNNIATSSTLVGGILNINHAHALGATTNKLIITGGTLQTPATVTLQNAIEVHNGPLNIDTTSRLTLPGIITGSTGIHKTGTGNAIINGNISALSGATNVSQGGLFLGTHITDVTVASGAAFGGHGTITGDITFDAGPAAGILQAGFTHNDLAVTAPSALNIIGAVNFLGDASLHFDMFGAGADAITAATASFAGSTNTIDLVNIQTGTFALLTLTTGTFDDITFALTQNNGNQLSMRVTATTYISDDKKSLLLESSKTNFNIKWITPGGGDWNINDTVWNSEDGAFDDGDKVTFGISGLNAINIRPAIVKVSELIIEGDGSYNFTGGSIVVDKNSVGDLGTSFQGTVPDGIFTINTTGTIIFSNTTANIFAQGIDLRQGTLIGTVDTLGDANIANAGKTVIQAHGGTAAYTGTMTGTGDLGIENGCLTIGGNLVTFTGKTEITDATLFIDDGAAFGSATITARNSTLFLGASATAAATSVTLQNQSAIVLALGSEISGSITAGDQTAISGAGRIVGNVATGIGSTITVGMSPQFPTGTDVLKTGAITLGAGSTITGEGTLDAASINFAGDLNLVNTHTTVTLNIGGAIEGGGAITKTGRGTVVLSTPSAYTGPTNITEGTLAAGAPNTFSPKSAFSIAPGATLNLRGNSQTIASLANSGHIHLSERNSASVGARLRITGAFDAAPGTGITFGIIARDNAPTLFDQLIFADATSISGTTTIFIQVTDNRSDIKRTIYDLAPLVIADSGTLNSGMFLLDDGKGNDFVTIGNRDYIFESSGNSIELVSTTYAEMPVAIAASAISMIATSAALDSIGQRLDYLLTADALPNAEHTKHQVWAQTYYRANQIDATLFPDAEASAWGIQAGIDTRTDKQGKAYTAMGAFVDRVESTADLFVRNSNADYTATAIGGYVASRTLKDWHMGAALRYSWDSYKINVASRSMKASGYTWGAMLRAARNHELGKNWSVSPEARLTYQNRKVFNATDDRGQTYAFDPENMGVQSPSSLESRLGAGLRKLVAINDTITIVPYISAHFLYEFKANLSIASVDNTTVNESFDGASYLLTVGLPVRFGNRIDAYIDASLKTGGPITGYGLNLGINYRW